MNEGLAPRLPDFPKGIPEARRAPEALERSEVNRLLREVEREGDPRDAALIRLMLSCGLRVSEAVSLRLEDVDIGERRGVITVRSGKGGKYREVPVPPAARRALREWLAFREKKYPKSPWLFPGASDEKHLTPGAAWRVVKKYAWKAKIPDLHPHTLRHTCATNMLRSGANLIEVASVLGTLGWTARRSTPGPRWPTSPGYWRGGRRSRLPSKGSRSAPLWRRKFCRVKEEVGLVAEKYGGQSKMHGKKGKPV
ncbi:tyrosine-type recombinase/integrase [Moorellaceae bacterium AZ2]